MSDGLTMGKKRFQFLRLMSYFKPYILLLLLSVLFAVLINAAILAKPYIMKVIIDDYLVVGKYEMLKIRQLGILFFLAILIGAVFGYIQTYLLTYIGQKIMFDIRNQLFKHIQNMSMTFFDKNSSGRILTRVTNDVESLDEVFSGVLINVFKDVILVIGIIVTMFVINLELALISISSVPLIALVTMVYRLAARKNFIKLKRLIGKMNGFLAENISGMKLVQIFHREKEKYKQYKKIEKDYFKTSFREIILSSLGRPIIDIINTLAIALLLWYFWRRITGMESVIEIGVLFLFISYIKQFFLPISEIAEKYTSLQSAIVSSQRIFDIIDTVDVVEDMDCGISIDSIKGEIDFKNVWFAYNDRDWVLRDVSFKINPGETVAFVGATGSGKSTIINLMARFYEVQRGEILIDGINIKDYKLKDLRRNISVVLQEVFLFAGNIKSNIRLNNDSISDEDIKFAAKHMNAHEFIEKMPKKYNQEVTENGSTFSAGQRQLISFARAVAFNPSVLVLDEATSNIDTDTEVKIQKAMERICKNRTSIIIAHRLSTIRNADRIIVIQNGKIKEMGNHDELIKQQGIYCKLYHIKDS